MTENDRLAWLQLAFTPYVGAEGFLLLLQRFGSAKAALDAPAEQIAAVVRHKQAAESWRNAEKRAFGLPTVLQHSHNGERTRNRNQVWERRIGLKFAGFILKY